jgi:hypoxanthine phosphoribosyltransferase
MNSRHLKEDVAEVLISEEEIEAKVKELAQKISEDYEGQELLLVCILKGGTVFLADLMREMEIPVEVDFMAISSYGDGTVSSGVVRILMDLETNIEGKNVLIVEDIIDTGRTIDYISEMLRSRDPASLRICTLLDKRARREVEVPLHYIGFQIPDKFVIGYGLDYGQIYRNLPFIGVLKAELYLPLEDEQDA